MIYVTLGDPGHSVHLTRPSTVHSVVAQITEGTAYDRRGRPFKRRNYLPGIALGVALLTVTAVVWLIALDRPADVRNVAVCNPPPGQRICART